MKKNPQEKEALVYVERLAVFVKGDGKVLASTLTDDKGDFELTFIPDKEKSFDFFCAGVGVDTVLLASFRSFESDTPEITFAIPETRKKNFLGKTLCPKCNKADKVYEIAYGDGLPVRMIISKSGDTTYSNLVNGRYNAGSCLVGVPKFYCDRDKVKF